MSLTTTDLANLPTFCYCRVIMPGDSHSLAIHIYASLLNLQTPIEQCDFFWNSFPFPILCSWQPYAEIIPSN